MGHVDVHLYRGHLRHGRPLQLAPGNAGRLRLGRAELHRPHRSQLLQGLTDGNAKLRVHFDRENHVRPWRRTIHVHVHDGTLKAGEHIWIVLGDRSGGSPGSQAQTFVESTFEFKFFADNFGTLQFRELPDAPVVRIVAGPAAHLVAQAPSMVAVDEEFDSLGARRRRLGQHGHRLSR